MKKGTTVYISPDLTNESKWIEGTVIKVHDNPFRGIIISAETDDHNVFFGEMALFRTQLPA